MRKCHARASLAIVQPALGFIRGSGHMLCGKGWDSAERRPCCSATRMSPPGGTSPWGMPVSTVQAPSPIGAIGLDGLHPRGSSGYCSSSILILLVVTLLERPHDRTSSIGSERWPRAFPVVGLGHMQMSSIITLASADSGPQCGEGFLKSLRFRRGDQSYFKTTVPSCDSFTAVEPLGK